MTLVLRKCKSDGSSRNEFKYGKVGDRVTCPDWNPEPICGYGLYGLKECNGDWGLLKGHDWLIIDADDQIVDIDEYKCKFNTGVILFRGTEEELANSEYPNKLNLNSGSAYNWAYYIGNHDIMINKIDNSEDAYYWALHIGNKDVMINKIDNSEDAYLWARDIGNRDIMKEKITKECWIERWNLTFPDNKIER